jgi:hypothetical protein
VHDRGWSQIEWQITRDQWEGKGKKESRSATQ